MMAKRLSCEHHWRRVYEQFILGGAFSVGWECTKCNEFIGDHELTPAGLLGTFSENEMRLVGPHGGYGTTSDGVAYKEQIVRADGTLKVIR